MRKGEMLVTSNFSFSHNVFQSYISLAHQSVALCGNGLMHLQKALKAPPRRLSGEYVGLMTWWL